MPTVRAFLILALLSASSAAAQSRLRPSSLDGVWIRTEQLRPDQTSFPAQPGMRIFSGGHYSWLAVFGEEPRPPLPAENGSAEELSGVWGDDRFTAEAGTFRIDGNLVTQRPIVAKNPNQMDPDWFVTLNWRLVGDTLYLSQVENPTGLLFGRQPTGLYIRVR